MRFRKLDDVMEMQNGDIVDGGGVAWIWIWGNFWWCRRHWMESVPVRYLVEIKKLKFVNFEYIDGKSVNLGLTKE